MQVVIMAGGKGERMESLFPSVPKALYPLGDGTIIDRLVTSLIRAQATEIIICCGHLAEKIESHFHLKYNQVRIIKEDLSLGTAGALGLIKNSLQDNFLVVNCDILIDLDFADLFKKHSESKVASTVVIKNIEQPMNCGLVVLSDKNEINKIVEKPIITHPVVIGVYAFQKKLVEKYLGPGLKLDMPEFLNKIISNSGSIGSYQYAGRWLDLGTPADYQKAVNLVL